MGQLPKINTEIEDPSQLCVYHCVDIRYARRDTLACVSLEGFYPFFNLIIDCPSRFSGLPLPRVALESNKSSSVSCHGTHARFRGLILKDQPPLVGFKLNLKPNASAHPNPTTGGPRITKFQTAWSPV